LNYSVTVVNESTGAKLPVGYIRIEGMPSRNHCQPLVDELVRVGLAHKYAHFTIIKVADFEFEVPLQGARVEVKIHGNEGEVLVDNSCPTMLKATTWQKVVGRLIDLMRFS